MSVALHRIRRDCSRFAALLLFPALLMCILGSGCEPPSSSYPSLEKILRNGEITVITRNNGHCYYLYRGEKMGFEYDLAKRFADALGVRLKVRIAQKWGGMIPDLMDGTGAFIAASMTITDRRRQQVAFSDGYLPVEQRIIVHRQNRTVRSMEDLDGQTVHVRKDTSYEERLRALQRQGIAVTIVTHPDVPTEELIRQVAEKKIQITVADSNIAMRNRRYYPQAIVAGAISDREFLGWAVHPRAHRLLARINSFFKTIKADGTFDEIYNRYYGDVDFFDFVDLRTFHRRIESRLPRYKEIIQGAAEKHGFDWRLIAAQIYQESHFNPEARSHSAAYGLMQLTATVARTEGVTDIFDPRQNIEAGVRHMKNLYEHFDKAIGDDRLYIALAAYNIGQGHVWDARNLARAQNLDPNRWASLEKTLPQLSYTKYFKHAKYGYARGLQPVDYVKQIQIYYDILKYRSLEIDGVSAPADGF
jgi:membrane-bound lytic murein transglycosylase F